MALFVANEVLSVYRSAESNPFVSQIIQSVSGNGLLTLDQKPIVIGQGGALVTAIFLFVLLAGTGTGIAFAMIRAGTQMVSPTFQYQLERMKWKLTQLQNGTGNR